MKRGMALGSLCLALASTGGIGCSSIEAPGGGGATGGNPGGSGGSTGAGGLMRLGSGGAGGAEPDVSCLGVFEGCISSCGAADSVVNPQASCDAQGRPQCPAGSQPFADCDPRSCARFYNNCCDPITGASGPAPCRPDGLRDACPANTRPAPDYQCIPDGLGVTDCLDLEGQPCSLESQLCHGGYGECRCTSRSASLIWLCAPFLP